MQSWAVDSLLIRLDHQKSLLLLVLGLSKNNRADEALSLFQQSSIPPNATTFTILFKICSQIGDEKALQYGKMMYETMPEIHRSSPYVSTSALKMLMQSGDIASAEKLFSQMKKDMQAYGVMMSGGNLFLVSYRSVMQMLSLQAI